ncbi:flavin monoamine oxidase family protein [Jatrophihabitans fulvus]
MTDAATAREHRCDVVVIGAGVAGLVAGVTLAPSTDVLVLEASARPGGRVESVQHGEHWLNLGAQFTEGTGALFDVMDRYGIERGSLAGSRAALYFRGRMVPTDRPVHLLLRSRLSPRARVELAAVGLRIKYQNWRLVHDRNPARARKYRDTFDSRSGDVTLRGVRTTELRSMITTWSGQWIGCDPHETAATQLAESIGTALEKAANVPNFALPVGGNQAFTDALAADLGERLHLGATVRAISWGDDEVRVSCVDAGGPVTVVARRAVVAVPADVARTLMPDLPDDVDDALADIDYGRYVLAGVFTDEQGVQRWDDHYGISTPELSFQMVFNHSASQRGDGPRRPGGALVCLAGGSRADELDRLSDAEIASAFRTDLLQMFPELHGHIERVVVKRQPRVVAYWKPGRRHDSQHTLRRRLGPIWFAGDYLGDPSLSAAASSGQRAARKVLDSLDPAGQPADA